jgi:hypothetical protein
VDCEKYANKNLYLGTGLCTPKFPTVGVPFDALGMMLLADRIRDHGNCGSIFHHIADTHAKSNDWMSDEEVDKLLALVSDTYNHVIRKFDIKNYNLIASSSFDTSSEYEDIYSNINNLIPNSHEYIRREVADIQWYKTKHNVCIKLGWIVSNKTKNIKFDERLFDTTYINAFSHDMSFFYSGPGRSFDSNRPNVPPYISIPNETRLILNKSFKIEEFLKNISLSKNLIKHYSNIIDLIDAKLKINTNNMDIEHRIINVYDILYN